MGEAAARSRAAAKGLKGTRATRYPGFIEPCLATLKQTVPEGPRWIHEIKYDGYRVQAHLRGGQAVIYTRNGYDWTGAFQPVAEALESLPARDLIVDGEIVVHDRHGIPDFAALQADLARRRTDQLLLYAFDLLYVDGEDIRPAPLIERKRLLGQLLESGTSGRILLSEHLAGQGAAMFEQACKMRLEGIISKNASAPYRSGRGESWIKVKCVKRDSFPIVAFVEKLGANPRRIASLYLGRWAKDRLLYAGKARTGYTESAAQYVRERLDPLIIPSTPLSVPVNKPKATWVRPVVEAEVDYASMTADGLLREPVFKGLSVPISDKPPAAPIPRRPRNASVPRENILQLLPEGVAPSREELESYWRRVAERALPYLARRPLKLVRHVRGTTFYHKGPLPSLPGAVHRLKVRKREGGEGIRVWVDDVEGLIGLVGIGAVELHPWNATVDDIEHADMLVFDLDPGEGVEWSFVTDTALVLRDLLADEGLESWPKLTGGKGIHLMVPVDAQLTHDETHDWCRTVAERLADANPHRYTVSAAVEQRSGRLFIDYLRNGRGTTAVGAFSPRARPGFPIAAPATWADVEQRIRPDTFNLQHLPPTRQGNARRR